MMDELDTFMYNICNQHQYNINQNIIKIFEKYIMSPGEFVAYTYISVVGGWFQRNLN